MGLVPLQGHPRELATGGTTGTQQSATCKRVLPEPDPAGTRIFQTRELGETSVCCLEAPPSTVLCGTRPEIPLLSLVAQRSVYK